MWSQKTNIFLLILKTFSVWHISILKEIPGVNKKGEGEGTMKPIGIIGGSGFYELLENPRMFVHNNRYGRSSEIFEGSIQGRKVYFLPRHGEEHKIIVPRIN